MATQKQTSKRTKQAQAAGDGVYLLKLVLYVILGMQWLWITQPNGSTYPLPVGLVLGLVFAAHEHFRVDRKIEYAILLAAMLAGFVTKIGIFVKF
jgi:hypothetical protein